MGGDRCPQPIEGSWDVLTTARQTPRWRCALLVGAGAPLLCGALVACGTSDEAVRVSGETEDSVVDSTDDSSPAPDEDGPDEEGPEPEPDPDDDDRSPDEVYADAVEAVKAHPGGTYRIRQEATGEGVTYEGAIEGRYATDGGVEAELTGALALGFAMEEDDEVIALGADDGELYFKIDGVWVVADEATFEDYLLVLEPLSFLDLIEVEGLVDDGEGEDADGNPTRRLRGAGVLVDPYASGEDVPIDVVAHVDEDGALNRVVVGFDEMSDVGAAGEMSLAFIDFGEQDPFTAPSDAVTLDEHFGYDEDLEAIGEEIQGDS